MKLTLAEPKFLTDSISIISELVNEVRFKIDKDKIELIAMDPANVAMIIFKLLSSAFTEYSVKKETEIAITLDSFKQILKRAKPSDILMLELDEKNNKLKIQLRGESTRTFNISLIDIEEKEQKVPDLKFSVKVETNTLIFDEAIEDMSIVGESVALAAQPDKFTIEAIGSLNTANVEITTDDETSIVMKGEDVIKSKYSLEYLKKIIKGSKLANTVTLQFDKDYPLRADYIIRDKLSFSVILAPRVENI